MVKRAMVTEADMRRAIKVAAECGLRVRECVMRPTEIRLIFASADERPASEPRTWPEQGK